MIATLPNTETQEAALPEGSHMNVGSTRRLSTGLSVEATQRTRSGGLDAFCGRSI